MKISVIIGLICYPRNILLRWVAVLQKSLFETKIFFSKHFFIEITFCQKNPKGEIELLQTLP